MKVGNCLPAFFMEIIIKKKYKRSDLSDWTFFSTFQLLVCLILTFIPFYSIIVVKLETKGGVKCGDVFWW